MPWITEEEIRSRLLRNGWTYGPELDAEVSRILGGQTKTQHVRVKEAFLSSSMTQRIVGIETKVSKILVLLESVIPYPATQ